MLKDKGIEITGTAHRTCHECGCETMVVFFKKDNVSQAMCKSCLYEKYGVGDPSEELFFCPNCERQMMKERPELERQKKGRKVATYICEHCASRACVSKKNWREQS